MVIAGASVGAVAAPLISRIVGRGLRRARIGIPELVDLPSGLAAEERYLLNLTDHVPVRLSYEFLILRIRRRELLMIAVPTLRLFGPERVLQGIASRRISKASLITGSSVGRRVSCEIEAYAEDAVDMTDRRKLAGLDLTGLTVSRQVCAIINSCESYKIVEVV